MRHQRVGLVQDDEAAGRIAEHLHAQLVIYGNLETRGGTKSFVPRFFVRDLKGAEELLGPSQLGGPVSFPNPMLTADALQARSQALTLFAIGLSYWTGGDFNEAIKQFDQATRVDKLKNSDGKEVLYLFLGSAYKSRSAAQNSTDDLVRARNAYSEAVRINLEYARAYIGLGNVYYEEYRSQYLKQPDLADKAKLEDAIREYHAALEAKDKPPTANVEAKIHIALGITYNAQAQAGQPELFANARGEFLQVIGEYEQDLKNAQLKAIAAQAYCGLGIVEERWTQDFERAVGFYQQCRDSTQDKEVQSLADTQLKIAQSRLSQPPPLHPQASVAATPTSIPQPSGSPCAGGLFGLGLILVALSQVGRFRQR